MTPDSAALERELEELRRENSRLREEARSVATANVQAAEHIVEMSLSRQRELEEHNERIQAALVLAEQASTEKTMFLANISHELRTPLNGIIGIADLLLDAQEQGRYRDQVEMLRHSGEALLAIVNDILDFSKVEVGRLELSHDEFDLWRLAEELVCILHAGNRSAGLDVRLSISPNVPRRVVGDELRIRQVLMNLAGNAVKFTKQGYVHVVLKVESGKVRFVVEDSGCGIEPELLGKLFEPFTQADGTASRKQGGTGLGLAISRRLVRLMGSDISVESELERGSVFSFDLDLDAQDACEARATADAAAGGRLTYTAAVLALGDEQLRTEVARHLFAAGVRVLPIDQLPGDSAPCLWICDAVPSSFEIAKARPDDRVIIYESTDRVLDATLERGDALVLQRPFMPTALLAQLAPLRCEAPCHDQDQRVRDRMKVLLVEDNEINACVAGTILRKLGCVVELAVNGAEAVEAVRQKRYDVVFMDCQMPVMDGYEATRRIRAMERGSGHSSFIVALTAHALDEDREQCLSVGMDAYVSKPTSRGALADILNAVDKPSGA